MKLQLIFFRLVLNTLIFLVCLILSGRSKKESQILLPWIVEMFETVDKELYCSAQWFFRARYCEILLAMGGRRLVGVSNWRVVGEWKQGQKGGAGKMNGLNAENLITESDESVCT